MTNKRVFISYAKEDKGFAEKLYRDLQQAGVRPWIDTVDLVPGQPWNMAIRKAISDSSYFIAVLSCRSVGKKGYVQREIRHALDIAEEYPEDKIFVIPMRIDDCEPSFEGLRKLHREDFFPSYDKGIKELLRVFKYESEEKPALVRVDAGKREGTIKKLTERGFGFIEFYGYIYGGDIFFHSNELKNVEFSKLHLNDIVLFSIAKGPKGNAAIDVERTKWRATDLRTWSKTLIKDC